MEGAASLEGLISQHVLARLTPEFIEKEVHSRADKLIVEAVDRALRGYSDTAKLIEQTVSEALRVTKLDLPSYGNLVAAMLKEQIEATVAPLVAGRLAADMDELLNLAPKHIKLSKLAEDMLEIRKGFDECYGPAITVIVEHNQYGSTWIYLDAEKALDDRDKYTAAIRLLVSSDGTISAATIDGRDLKSSEHFGRSLDLEQRIRAMYAVGTVIEIDEDFVCTSLGDY